MNFELDYVNGSAYEGTWINGIMTGDEEMFIDTDGTTYVGPWKNGIPNGIHNRTTTNGVTSLVRHVYNESSIREWKLVVEPEESK